MKEYFEISKYLVDFIERLKEEYKLSSHETFFLHCAETQFIYVIESLIREKQQKATDKEQLSNLNKSNNAI